MSKYKFTKETKNIETSNGIVTVTRIRATQDFDDIKKGDLGGWIEEESNLSQEGNSWVGDDAVVYDHTVVCEDAKVGGITEVHGPITICGHTKVYGGLTCTHCGFKENSDNEFVGIFASGVEFVNTNRKICGLYVCPVCGTINYTTDHPYMRMRKEKFRKTPLRFDSI